MKKLLLSTVLLASSFSSFATEGIFESERWKEIKLDSGSDPYWAHLDLICNEKLTGSRPPNISDLIAFSDAFKNEYDRPKLYSFLRETFGFADSNDPQIQAAFELNGKHRTISLPFYFHDSISFYNPTTLVSIAKNEDDKLVANLALVDATGSRSSLITLAPSLGEAKVFCIIGEENGESN
ncbi:hypothetical protein [Aliivibrio fischeri]|uniref:hypothetical protein n=1 Tax=Aliivibrio fischeri TaxID=668 RepID=UPI00166620F5|nr:hypothetical protein [Aliivibrio fischeri]USR97925.1 hypothetical protein AVFI_15785 [Aliivibrio fischeri ATCC 7744 = JCM 18803 = DSM 507]GGK20503.1 hypothetical protein GCM10007987_00540 [Aliivibrio fischeri]